jgi:ribose/xylose/arabinose/galactoside ABC-type transport system permease subunit
MARSGRNAVPRTALDRALARVSKDAALRAPGIALRTVATARLSGLAFAIFLTGLAFNLENHFFLSKTNMLGLARSMTTLSILAFGETLVLVGGEIDLSLGATYGLGAMSLGELWLHGVPFWLSFLLALLIGSAVGAVNAFLVTVLDVNSFVTTLGTLNVAQGITYLISNSSSVNPASSMKEFGFFYDIGAAQLPGQVPVQILWLIGVGIVMWALLHRTLFGFRLAAIGGNPAAARAAHLPIRRTKAIAYMLAGLCASLGGIIDFSLVGATDPSSGTDLTFTVFAAVIIGGASLYGGRGSIIGTLVGALLLDALTNGLTLVGVGTFAQLLFVGLIIIAAVAIDRWSSRIRRRAEVQV